MLAILCATVLLLTRMMTPELNADEWLVKKQATAISCIRSKLAEPGSSDDKNNGGCPHQLGASCLLTTSGDKRNKTYSC